MKFEEIRFFPKDIPLVNCTIRATNAIGRQTNPFNFKTETQIFPASRWEIELSILPTERAEIQAFEAWLLSLRGSAGKFKIGDPWRSEPLGRASGSPRVAFATAGAETFSSHGWQPSTLHQLQAGDYIEIENRLYCVLDHVSSDQNGNANISVFPPLRAAHPNGATIRTRNACGVFTLGANQLEFSRDLHNRTAATFTAIEFL